MDAKGSLAAAFDIEPLRFQPREMATGIFGMTMNTEDSLREYLQLYVKLPFVTRLGLLSRTFDFVADAAPGVKEILSLGKLCYEVRERHYDLVVVDGVATGQVAAQLGAPTAIGELIQVGPVKAQTRWMQEIIEDPARTGVVVVTTPEEMPVNETVELVGRLQSEIVVDVAAVVVNRVLPELFSRSEEAVFAALARPQSMQRLREAAGAQVDTVFEGARIAVAMRRSGAAEIERLRKQLPAGQPLVYVPELFSKSTARRHVELVADSLGEELS